jgi:excisionase family DNA binding protein
MFGADPGCAQRRRSQNAQKPGKFSENLALKFLPDETESKAKPHKHECFRGTVNAFVQSATTAHFQEKERGMNLITVDAEVLTVKEVSKLLRVHPTTVYRLIRQGKIPSFQIGTDWRFLTHRLARWMVEQSIGASQ